jgi:hypothetical protein
MSSAWSARGRELAIIWAARCNSPISCAILTRMPIGRVYLPIEAMAAAGIAITTPQAMLPRPISTRPRAGWPRQGAAASRRGARAAASKPRGLLRAAPDGGAYAPSAEADAGAGLAGAARAGGHGQAAMLLLALRWWIFG